MRVPESFKKSIIFPLHKKGDLNAVENYRGILFTDTLVKLFTGVILNRLVNWELENDVVNEY